MKNILSFISKYALFFLIAGALLFFITLNSISNLPNPSMLPPIYVQAEYYRPLRFLSMLRIFSIIIILISAFFFVQGVNKMTGLSTIRRKDSFCANCGSSVLPKDSFCSQCGGKNDM